MTQLPKTDSDDISALLHDKNTTNKQFESSSPSEECKTKDHIDEKKLRLSFKAIFALFIIGLFINTDIFVNGCISHFHNATRSDGQTTGKGALLQALSLVVLFIIVHEALIREIL